MLLLGTAPSPARPARGQKLASIGSRWLEWKVVFLDFEGRLRLLECEVVFLWLKVVFAAYVLR